MTRVERFYKDMPNVEIIRRERIPKPKATPRKPSMRFVRYLAKQGFQPGDTVTARQLSYARYRQVARQPLPDEMCEHTHRTDDFARGNAGFEIRRMTDYGFLQKLSKGVYLILRLTAVGLFLFILPYL